MHAGRGVGQDLRQELALRLLHALFFALREERFGLQLLLGRQRFRVVLRSEPAQLVDPQEAAASRSQLVVDSKGIHPRTVLVRLSGRLRRDTRSLTHFTERFARSHTIGNGSWR